MPLVFEQAASIFATVSGPTILTGSLPLAPPGNPYSFTFTAANGTPPYSWTRQSLGAFSFSDTGVLSGTPEAAGVFSFVATVTDANELSSTAGFSILVDSQISITTNALSNAEVTQTAGQYSFTLSASGGTAPLTWSIPGSPTGTVGAFQLSSAGVLTNTRTLGAPGTFSIPFMVTDKFGLSATVTLPLTVLQQVILATTSLPTGTVGTPYSTTLSGALGESPYSFGMTPSPLDGLTLTAAGLLSGTPTTAETVLGTFTVTDALGVPSAPTSLSLTVQSSSGPIVFKYFITPNGDDANSGLSVAEGWSLSAINNPSLRLLYAGQNVGLVEGLYTQVQASGVATSLYTYWQNTPVTGGLSLTLNVQGGPSNSQRTVLASCDAAGNYKPWAAVIDWSQGGAGSLPSLGCCALGQSQSNTTSGAYPAISQYGNVSYLGIAMSRFVAGAIAIYGPSLTFANVTVQDCHFWGSYLQIGSSGNPAIIQQDGAISNVLINNNLMHDCACTSDQWAYTGILNIQNSTIAAGPGFSYTNNVIYNMDPPIYLKNNNLGGTNVIAYNYLDLMCFGTGVSGNDQGLKNADCIAGATLDIHHNIMVGPIYADKGANSNANRGMITIRNNSFYMPAGASQALLALAAQSESPGTISFYNNVVWSDYPTGNPYNHGGNNYTIAFDYQEQIGYLGIGTLDNNLYGTSAAGSVLYSLTSTANISLATMQGTYGYEKHSQTTSARPYAAVPSVNSAGVPNPLSWVLSSAAQTTCLAMPNGVLCGALNAIGTAAQDGNPIGCNLPGINGKWWAPNSIWNSLIPSGAFSSPVSNSSSFVTNYEGTGFSDCFVPQSGTFTACQIVAPAGTATISWTFSYNGSWTFPLIPAGGAIGTQVTAAYTYFGTQGDTDKSINLYSTDTGMMYDIYPDNAGGGNGPFPITCASVRPLSGSGYWNQANFTTLSSGTASGADQTGGSIKPSEWTAGVIPHALMGALTTGSGVYNIAGRNPASPDDPAGDSGAMSCIFPARGSDAPGASSTGCLPEGSRLQLDPSLSDSTLTGLGVSTAMLPVCHAMQQYGWYAMDIGSTFAFQIKFMSTNPHASTGFIGSYPGAGGLPMALVTGGHIQWVPGPWISGTGALGPDAKGVTITGTAGQCAYTTNWGSPDGLVHAGDIVTVYPARGYGANPGTGGLQGFSPNNIGTTAYWAGVGYRVQSTGSGTFTLATLAGAAITSTAGTMNVYFTTNAPHDSPASAGATGYLT